MIRRFLLTVPPPFNTHIDTRIQYHIFLKNGSPSPGFQQILQAVHDLRREYVNTAPEMESSPGLFIHLSSAIQEIAAAPTV